MDDAESAIRFDRRRFIGATAIAAGALATSRTLLPADFAFASVTAGSGPYGPLQPANADGIQLPVGFTSRIIARSGEVVPGSGYTWHGAPDGGACFTASDGGWVYVSNSELAAGTGGVGAIRFGPDGEINDAYRLLSNTTRNCAGGPTPWGTWLSCEENGAAGKVYECDPSGPGQGSMRPALGSFNHEAASVDPTTGRVYLTEDDASGRLYRFTPSVPGDLSNGVLEAARVSGTAVTWIPTSTTGPDRQSTTTAFNRAEGSWIAGRSLFFATTGNNRVYELALDTQRVTILYDAAATPNTPLTGVDNVTAHPSSRDLFIAEDGGNMELGVIATVSGIREVAPFLRITGQDSSEVTGPAFSPDGTRLYLSSQRGTSGAGITYEITGPFRTTPPSPVVVSRVAPSLGPGASWREVYIDGAGFNTGTTVSLGEGVTVHSAALTSSTRLTVKLSIAEAAAVGPRTAIVAASGGVTGSCGGCFQVLPPPVVSSVTPSTWAPGSTVEVTISGVFNSWGVSVSVSGTGVTVGSLRVTTSTLVATMTVAAGAATGERLLTVRNGDQGVTRVPVTIGATSLEPPAAPTSVAATPGNGQATVQFSTLQVGGPPESYVVRSTDTTSGLAGPVASGNSSPIVVTGLSNGVAYTFTVSAVNAAGESPSSAPSLPVTPVAPPPPSSMTITSVTPGLGPGASNREVYVNGTGFVTGCRVTIGGGVSVGVLRSLTSTRIAVAVSVPESAAPGPRDVTVTAPDGSSVILPNGFTVLPPPVITGVVPNSWTRGSSVAIEISGSNFSSWGLNVGVNGTGVSTSNIVRSSSTTVRATITVAATASSGARTLTVRNGDQGLARTTVTVV
jgi:hypothetical protein